MPRIVDMDALIPEDIEFRYRDESYLIPGDIRPPDAFNLVRLYEEGVAAQEKPTAEREAADTLIQKALTDLFRIRQPDLEELPFGMRGYQVILAEVLTLLGFQIIVEDPPVPRARKQAVPRSRRSSGSRK